MRRKLLVLTVLAGLTAGAQTRNPATLPELSASLSVALAPGATPRSSKLWRSDTAFSKEDESDEPGLSAKQQSSGSGVIIDADGYIVTNAHVVHWRPTVNVTLPPSKETLESRRSAVRPLGPTLSAEVVGLDLETDIALLKIPRSGVPGAAAGRLRCRGTGSDRAGLRQSHGPGQLRLDGRRQLRRRGS